MSLVVFGKKLLHYLIEAIGLKAKAHYRKNADSFVKFVYANVHLHLVYVYTYNLLCPLSGGQDIKDIYIIKFSQYSLNYHIITCLTFLTYFFVCTYTMFPSLFNYFSENFMVLSLLDPLYLNIGF